MFNHKGESKKEEHKKISVRNMPLFFVVGIILMIIIIISIYYIFLYYSPEFILPYSGYAIQGKIMVESLKSDNADTIQRYIDLVEVKEQELIYKKLNSYYVGTNDKTEIDVDYPIYVNELNTLLNLSENTKLITVSYEEVDGYPEFLLTGRVMYNGDDLTRADGNEYLFLKTDDEIYTNVAEIEIKTQYNTYKIKENSNMYITEESISYYEVNGTYLEYHKIEDIDNNSKVIINGEELTYREFLKRLGYIEEEPQVEKGSNEVEEQNIIQNNTTEEETEPESEELPTDLEEKWVKPEVSCTEFEENVYSIHANLEIIDKVKAISRGIVFELRKDGKINRRVQAMSSGRIEISGLEPNTEYEITGIFYYRDEEDEEQTEQFFKGTVHTKDIENLETLKLSFENGDLYSNKIEIKNIKITNELTDEVIKGITRIEIEIDKVKYQLLSDSVRKLKRGEKITYQTSENIKSNKVVKYEIKAYDKYGNELRIDNSTGETKTLKEKPQVSINVTKQNVIELQLSLKLTNNDNIDLQNYRYIITDQIGNIIKENSLNKNDNILIFNDLDPNDYFKIEVYADYDLEDGNGLRKNQIIGTGTFVTRIN